MKSAFRSYPSRETYANRRLTVMPTSRQSATVRPRDSRRLLLAKETRLSSIRYNVDLLSFDGEGAGDSEGKPEL